ncbi:hypothetical protein FRC02_011885 [Tulasnella sp. 418]|nr:hypothetical protein FRC02_011885 [Tulasnella sp. 418]
MFFSIILALALPIITVLAMPMPMAYPQNGNGGNAFSGPGGSSDGGDIVHGLGEDDLLGLGSLLPISSNQAGNGGYAPSGMAQGGSVGGSNDGYTSGASCNGRNCYGRNYAAEYDSSAFNDDDNLLDLLSLDIVN